MREADRMKFLVCDAIDTMSRMSDRLIRDSAQGISEHVDDLLDQAEGPRKEDLAAACLEVAIAIIQPLSETMIASSTERQERARAESY